MLKEYSKNTQIISKEYSKNILKTTSGIVSQFSVYPVLYCYTYTSPHVPSITTSLSLPGFLSFLSLLPQLKQPIVIYRIVTVYLITSFSVFLLIYLILFYFNSHNLVSYYSNYLIASFRFNLFNFMLFQFTLSC